MLKILTQWMTCRGQSRKCFTGTGQKLQGFSFSFSFWHSYLKAMKFFCHLYLKFACFSICLQVGLSGPQITRELLPSLTCFWQVWTSRHINMVITTLTLMGFEHWSHPRESKMFTNAPHPCWQIYRGADWTQLSSLFFLCSH